MPWIDPARTRLAIDHLRSVSERADDLSIDIRRLLTLSDLPPDGASAVCREIDEELSDLAVVVEQRLAIIEGHELRLPGDWGRQVETHLMASLIDHDGARADLGGGLALEIVVRNGLHLATPHRFGYDDEKIITVETLLATADDPSTDPVLAAACRNLAGDATMLASLRSTGATWLDHPAPPAGSFRLAAAAVLVERNELLTTLAPLAVDLLDHPDTQRLGDDDLVALGIDPRTLDDLDLPRDPLQIVGAAIDNGTFAHSPSAAAAFIETLPTPTTDGHGLELNLARPDAIGSLFDVATTGLDTLDDPVDAVRWTDLASRLPESAGVRAQIFATGYALMSRHMGVTLAGPPGEIDPGRFGADFFVHAASASVTVSLALNNELRTWGLSTPAGVDRDLADGNQAIFVNLAASFGESVDGRPISDPNIAAGIERWEAAWATDDPVERQRLVVEGNFMIALSEQRIVDPHLQFPSVGPLERLGVLVTLRDFHQFTTDHMTMEFADVDGNPLGEPVRLGEPLPEIDDPANLVGDLDPCGVDPLYCGDLPAPDRWAHEVERMPAIAEFMILFHTHHPLVDAAKSRLWTDDDEPLRPPPGSR